MIISWAAPDLLSSANGCRLQYTFFDSMEIKQTSEFRRWLKKLKDKDAVMRIALRLRRIELTGNLGDAKPLSDGVSELRFDFGPGYRVYFSRRGQIVLLLLVGGDKSSQQADIAKAKKLNKKYFTGE